MKFEHHRHWLHDNAAISARPRAAVLTSAHQSYCYHHWHCLYYLWHQGAIIDIVTITCNGLVVYSDAFFREKIIRDVVK